MPNDNHTPITYRGELVGYGEDGIDAAWARARADGLIKPPEPPPYPADLSRRDWLRLQLERIERLDDTPETFQIALRYRNELDAIERAGAARLLPAFDAQRHVTDTAPTGGRVVLGISIPRIPGSAAHGILAIETFDGRLTAIDEFSALDIARGATDALGSNGFTSEVVDEVIATRVPTPLREAFGPRVRRAAKSDGVLLRRLRTLNDAFRDGRLVITTECPMLYVDLCRGEVTPRVLALAYALEGAKGVEG